MLSESENLKHGHEFQTDRVALETKLPPILERSVLFMRKNKFLIIPILLLVLLVAGCATPQPLRLATTTSVNDSGLLEHLRPAFEEETGITLQVIAQGTGKAIETGKAGDADVLLLHARSAEEEFVAGGYGLERIEFMYNYFVIVGPPGDPAQIAGMGSIAALTQIMENEVPFVSRGDNSGTHMREMSLWGKAQLEPSGDWYIQAGAGMGAVLSMASEMQAYTLTDEATFLAMRDELELELVVEGDADLRNPYSVIAVNPEKHDGINNRGAQRFIEWITSQEVLDMIAQFGIEEFGESLFIPLNQ